MHKCSDWGFWFVEHIDSIVSINNVNVYYPDSPITFTSIVNKTTQAHPCVQRGPILIAILSYGNKAMTE